MPKKKIRIGIHGDTPDELVERPLAGLLEFAAQRRNMMLCDCRMSLEEYDFRTNDPPWKGRVDGVVLTIGLQRPATANDIARWIARGGVPVVSTSSDIIHPRIPLVCMDVASLAQLATDHLVQCGCRSFLYAGYALSMGSRRRAVAFRRVLAERGFKLVTFDFTSKCENGTESALQADDARKLAPLLEAAAKPLGVLALGDPFARGVLRICDSLGLQVPRQVAIVGANNTPLAYAQWPTLTSICYPGEVVGHRAATLLLELIAGAPPPRRPIEIPAPGFVVRESTSGSVEEGDEMAKALEMIRRQACTGLKVNDLVESLSQSKRWLELAFRKNLERSPRQEIQRVQLLQARRLLELTDLTMTQIAGMVGFAETSGLTHFFRKHTGYSPTEYREWAHGVRGVP